jgi:probable DNA metabolism protein
MIYRYDGSFAGLLCVCALTLDGADPPQRIERPPYSPEGLFDQVVDIPTCPETARSMRTAVQSKLDNATLASLRLAYLSERPGIERHLWHYLALGWQVGPDLNSYLAHPDVQMVHAWSQRTLREAHRMKGLTRFRELADGTFYAPLKTDTNVLPLLAGHFAGRMDCPWLVHDVARGLGIIGDARRVMLGRICEEAPPQYSSREQAWQELWQNFHAAIAIETRKNPARQKQFMPLKYHEFLIECLDGSPVKGSAQIEAEGTSPTATGLAAVSPKIPDTCGQGGL